MSGSDGFTYDGAVLAMGALLTSGTPVWGKLYKADAVDGTMNPSSVTTRVQMIFGQPDSNGIFDLTAAVEWGPWTVIEQVWGVGFFTSATAGKCLYLKPFSQPKNQYINDKLDLVSLPMGLPIVGQ